MRRPAIFAVLLALAGLAGYQLGARERPPVDRPPHTGPVVRVVDGDTVHVELAGEDETVRLIGIDTPETHGRGGLRECFGKEATEHLEKLLPEGTLVRVERDAESRDRYGRLLGYIHRDRDGMFVNLEMARAGYAAALTIPPNVAHASDFVAAAGAARQAGRGLWGACGGPDKAIP